MDSNRWRHLEVSAHSEGVSSRSYSRGRDSREKRGTIRLDATIADYLDEVRAQRSTKAVARLKPLFNEFRSACTKRFLHSINRRDLIEFMAVLRDRHLSDRTIFNRLSTLLTFFKRCGIEGLLSKKDLPRYTKKSVDAYSESDIGRLLRAARKRTRLILEFFLATGCREQEVAYMTWNDIDFEQKIVRVTAKPQWDWKPKDCEERAVPIPERLVEELKAFHRRSASSALLFPNQLDQPDGHFLSKLKNLALKADCNCGHCINKAGKSCKDSPVCSRWSLHKFRRTFATMHHEAGVSARTLQAWLGHSSLETTLRYLRVADLNSEQIRSQVETTFAKLIR